MVTQGYIPFLFMSFIVGESLRDVKISHSNLWYDSSKTRLSINYFRFSFDWMEFKIQSSIRDIEEILKRKWSLPGWTFFTTHWPLTFLTLDFPIYRFQASKTHGGYLQHTTYHMTLHCVKQTSRTHANVICNDWINNLIMNKKNNLTFGPRMRAVSVITISHGLMSRVAVRIRPI